MAKPGSAEYKKNVHLAHCYQGEYNSSCKYGEEYCPAKPTYTETFTEERRKEVLDILMRDADKYRPSTTIGVLTSEILRLQAEVAELKRCQDCGKVATVHLCEKDLERGLDGG